MQTYIALLRGINVGPHKRIKMEKLRASCEALGFKKVKTYIQSGNLVLKADKLSSAAAAKKLETQIVRDFGFSADVVARSAEEMKEIVEGNPLLKETGVDTSRLHVMFLADAPAPAAVKKLEAVTVAPDKVRFRGKEIYFYFPNGVSGSSIWKQNLDRLLSVSGTIRNWNTVKTLYEMAMACK